MKFFQRKENRGKFGEIFIPHFYSFLQKLIVYYNIPKRAKKGDKKAEDKASVSTTASVLVPYDSCVKRIRNTPSYAPQKAIPQGPTKRLASRKTKARKIKVNTKAPPSTVKANVKEPITPKANTKRESSGSVDSNLTLSRAKISDLQKEEDDYMRVEFMQFKKNALEQQRQKDLEIKRLQDSLEAANSLR